MNWLEAYEHPALGTFKPDGDDGWRGRSGRTADFYDLFVMHNGSDSDAPAAAAVVTLERAVREIEHLKAASVDAVCAARQGRLSWRDGPPVGDWTIIELRIDAACATWLTLSDGSDEYSRWLVRTDVPVSVRRIPALELKGDPANAGDAI